MASHSTIPDTADNRRVTNALMKLYIKEPRLYLSTTGEFFVRLVSYSSYALLTAITLVFLLSDIPNLRWFAVFLALFLVNRARHINKGERAIPELREEGEKKKEINTAQALTPASYRIISTSFREALMLKKNFYLILLKHLVQRKTTKEAFKRLNIDPKQFLAQANTYTGESAIYSRKELLQAVSMLIKTAYRTAEFTNEKFIRPRNLLVALAETQGPAADKLFNLFNVTVEDLQGAVMLGRYRPLFRGVKRTPSVLGGFAHHPFMLRKRIMNRSWTARPTPHLDTFSTDLTALARREKVGLLIGHQKEFKELLAVLTRLDKPNALLVGEPGTGKSTIIAHLAFRIIKDRVPKTLFDRRLISLDMGALIANAPPEELAGRLKRITDEIIQAGNIVLFIPNIHDLFKPVGGAKSFNAMDILLPVIKSNVIPLIGETYPREFKQYIEQRSEFLEQFETVSVEEITQEEALRVLIYQTLLLENQFKTFITFRAIKQAVRLAYRYLHHKPLPSSAVDLLKQAIMKAKQGGLNTTDADVVIELAQEISKIPIQRAGEEETEKLLNLEAIIHKRLINQDAGVNAVARALREYRSGLSHEGRPIATFLFVGPTGVGKTELAKILTEIQFGSRTAIERFDMSEYQDKQSIFRLIGTPNGERTGALTDAILEQPYRLILLDEFEKAHPDVLNLFLQVFDDGRLTDSLGRTVNFENTIIITTSNAHSDYIKESIEQGKTIADISEELKKKLTTYFKPELLNRFSDVVMFRGLNRDEIKAVAKILIRETAKTLTKKHGIELIVEESAVAKIAELGFSPVFGARPLRKTISEHVRSVLADKILRKEIGRGNTIHITYENDAFQFAVTQ